MPQVNYLVSKAINIQVSYDRVVRIFPTLNFHSQCHHKQMPHSPRSAQKHLHGLDQIECKWEFKFLAKNASPLRFRCKPLRLRQENSTTSLSI